MSHHRDKRNSPELDGLLRQHRLATDTPSQLSDAFRLGYWSAQAEIARLQKEVERYEEQNRALLDDQITCACGYDDPNDVCGKHHPAFNRKLVAAHNDAIEAAYQAALTCDGALNNAGAVAAKIRTLKRPAQEQPK